VSRDDGVVVVVVMVMVLYLAIYLAIYRVWRRRYVLLFVERSLNS
jgi:hypothetical protein